MCGGTLERQDTRREREREVNVMTANGNSSSRICIYTHIYYIVFGRVRAGAGMDWSSRWGSNGIYGADPCGDNSGSNEMHFASATQLAGQVKSHITSECASERTLRCLILTQRACA